MAEFVRSPRSRHLSGTKAEEITGAIVNMVVQDYPRFSLRRLHSRTNSYENHG